LILKVLPNLANSPTAEAICDEAVSMVDFIFGMKYDDHDEGVVVVVSVDGTIVSSLI